VRPPCAGHRVGREFNSLSAHSRNLTGQARKVPGPNTGARTKNTHLKNPAIRILQLQDYPAKNPAIAGFFEKV